MKKIISSESVNCGHPDKTCDIIADAILDEILKQDPYAQNSIECAIKDDLLAIYGESTTKVKVNIEKIARQILLDMGYKNKFKIIKKISKQSTDIAQAVIKDKFMANDQGMMYGFACNETKEFMPLPIMMAHLLMKKYEDFRQQNNNYFSDAKSQVSIAYENNMPTEIDTIVISVSHKSELSHEQLEQEIFNNVVKLVLEDYKNIKQDKVKILINPSGKFTIWGSFSDSGCVGRKIVVDTYGGVGRVGGGCFSSKNATKVDRSGAYYARYVAKNIVAHNLAERCEIQLSYAIGQEFPVSVYIDCFNTEKVALEKIYDIVSKNFNFSVDNIIKELDLLKPIYKETACYGHFGREDFSWEKIIKLNI
jgi:S-adenosylmethionine synthetase